VAEQKKDSSKMVVSEVQTSGFADSTVGQGETTKAYARGMASDVTSELGGREIATPDMGTEDGPAVGDIAVGASVENLEKVYALLGQYRD
jgi:hypothetical protein